MTSNGKVAAGFPISMGHEARDPLPVGKMAIKNAVDLPSYTYDPSILKTAPKNAAKAEIPPGPNNPVGTVWLGLTKPHWGIHGTPEPDKIGKTASHGCVRLPRNVAEILYKQTSVGTPVTIQRTPLPVPEAQKAPAVQ